MTLPWQIKLIDDLIRQDPDITIAQYLDILKRVKPGLYVVRNGKVISKAETKKAI